MSNPQPPPQKPQPMAEMADNPYYPVRYIVFGPEANCTLVACPLEWSVYHYRPSLAASGFFIAIFGIAMLVHIGLGIRWRSWFFMSFMILGCATEMVGYGGRIMLYDNPFDFIGFIIQICLITTGPVFYTAAIYVTLSKTIEALDRSLSRASPKLFYWVFIPADIICLVLQGAGGALSSISSGSSQTGIDIAMAGLILQVLVLAFFLAALSDYMIRFVRARSLAAIGRRVKLYFGFLLFAIVMIFGRCIFRCYELSKGYQDSDLITDQGLFIGLEGVLVVLAVFALCVGHPGFLRGRKGGLGAVNPPSLEDGAVAEHKSPAQQSTDSRTPTL